MEARHGPALSQRERQELTGIEEALREDQALEQQLRTMRLRGLRRLRPGRRRRSHGRGNEAGAGG